MTPYYHLVAKAAPENLSADGARLAREWVCEECKQPRPGVQGVDVTLASSPSVPLNFVAGAGVAIVRKDLLDVLGSESIPELWLGEVRVQSEGMLPDYFTVRGRFRATIRGDASSVMRRCATCGRVLYHPFGPRYVLRSEVLGRRVLESQLHQPIVVGELVAAARNLTGIHVQRLATLDQARDGLPLDLGARPPILS